MENLSPKERLYIERFNERCDEIEKATADTPIDETAQEKERRIKKLLSNYADFIAYYLPHLATCEPGKFQKDAARDIDKHPTYQSVEEWARGHAKSVTFDIGIPLWQKAKGDMKFMVLVGKSQDNAEYLLADIKAELQTNQRYKHDFGEQRKYGDWAESRFSTQDGCAFVALGRGQSARGLRKGKNRPDYIVIDDLDDDELVQNPKRVRKLVDWIKEALFGALDMGRGRFIMVGNRIHKDSVLANIAKIKSLKHRIVNALDKDGGVTWKEKYSLQEIQDAMAFMGYRSAQKEFFNNPIVEGTVFKNEWINYERIPKSKFQYILAYCDPSFKSSAQSDYKAVAVMGKMPDGHLHVIDAFVRQCSVAALVGWFFDLHAAWADSKTQLRSYIEANFLQDMLYEEFKREGEKRGWHLPISGDKRKKPDKFQRIEGISPLFERGLISFNAAKKENNDFKQGIEQLLCIEKGSRTPDDFPDALEGGIWMLQKQARLHAPENKTRYIKRSRKNDY